MSDVFDPYYKWLGIPASEQPPNYYRLLGINSFETDPQVIEAAADRQMSYLRTFQTGQHIGAAQKLLNEIAQARVCLLNAAKKAEYDADLKRRSARIQNVASVVPPPAAPVSPPVVAAVPIASRPLPQARRMEAMPAQPDVLPNAVLASAPSAVARPRRKPTPLWRQPAVLVVLVLSISLAAVAAVWFKNGDKREPVAVAPPISPATIDPSSANGNSTSPAAASPEPPSQDPSPPSVKPAPLPPEVKPAPPSPPAVTPLPAPVPTPLANAPGSVDPLPAGKDELSLVCESLSSDLTQTGLARGASFLRDKLERHVGDRGFVIQAPTDWANRGTRWMLDYRHPSDSWRWLRLVHPWRGGQLIVAIGNDLQVRGGREWRGWRAPANPVSGQGVSFRLTSEGRNHTPTKVDHLYQVDSRLDPDGKYKLYLDGVLCVEGEAPNDMEPLEFKTASTTNDNETGTEKRVFQPGECGVFLADSASKAQMHQVRFGPAHPAVSPARAVVAATSQESGPRFDMLKQLDAGKNVVRGTPVRTGTASSSLMSLSSAANQWALFQIPYRPGNREYALEIVAELVDKGGPLNVGLVCANTGALVSLDYGGKTGLSEVDGNMHFANPQPPLTSGSIFAGGARPTIRINVRQQGLEVLADGRLLLEWKDYSRLSPNTAWQGPDKQALTIGWNSGTFRIDKLDVIQFSGRFPTGGASTTVAAAGEETLPGQLPTTQAMSARLEAPPAKDLQAAEQQVRSVFRDEFEKAAKADAKTKPEAKLALARTLAEKSEQTRDNPAEHYTMLKLSLDTAADAGDAELALKVLGTLTASYKIDLPDIGPPVLTELARTAKTNEARTRVVEAALDCADACVDDDKFEAATQMANLAMSTVTKLRDNELRKTVKEQQDQIKLLQKQFETASAAAETLKQTPDDPAANLAWGKYLCLVKQDWEPGLPHLARSSDSTLKAAAQRELVVEKKPEDKSALADAWFDLAKAAAAADRGVLEARAESWYQDALDEVTGLAKAHVERRLSDLKASEAAKPVVAARVNKNSPPKPGMAGRVILDNGDSGLTVFYQPGMQLRDETLKQVMAKANIKWRPLQVDLGGYFSVPVSGSVYFHQSCQGPVDAGCRLLVDGKELFTVGPANNSSTHGRSMGAGVHTIRWIVAGRDAIGQCDLRVYHHPNNGNSENLPIVYLPQGLVAPRQVKAKGEADLSTN